MDNKQDGAVFCRIEMIKFKIVKLQYKRYLKKNIRPESKKYTGQIYILKNYHHLDDEEDRQSTEKRELKVISSK